MISEHCDLEAFFSEINGKRKGEAILMALQEATAAERMLLSKKGGAVEESFSPPAYSEYSESLKEFIHYIRCDARPKLADDVKNRLFHAYLDSRKPYISLLPGKEA
jgi:DNA replicative helicase MCM subunit Mcm2 (Cdc46/Mcm family)